MADQDDSAAIFVERVHQGFARIDVKVVCRFIEDQQMRGIAGDHRQRQSRAFATGKLANLDRRLVAGKAETAKLRAHRARLGVLHQPGHMFQRRIRRIQFLDLILREIADGQLARLVDRALLRFELAGEQPGQRGLAVAVPPQQGGTVVGVEAHVEAGQDDIVAIADGRVVERDQRRFQFGGTRKMKTERRIVDRRGNRLHPRQRLDPALRLLRAVRLGPPAGDEGFQLLALGDLLFARGGELRLSFGSLLFEGIIAAGIERGRAVLQMQDMVDDIVEQIAFVADYKDSRLIAGQEIFQPQRCFEIEMVGRLVEQQHFRLRKQQRRQRNPHPPAAGKAVHRLLLGLFVKAQTDQDFRGPRRRAVRLDHVQPLVDFADPVRIGSGFRLFQQCGALNIGGEHGIQRAVLAGGRFLRDIAEPGLPGHVDAAVVGLEHAGDHLHQGRLAGTIAADHADPRPRG